MAYLWDKYLSDIDIKNKKIVITIQREVRYDIVREPRKSETLKAKKPF